MIYRLKVLFSAITCSLLLSCVTDEQADCFTDINIIFKYTHNATGGDLFSNEVNDVVLFLYDESGNILQASGYRRSELINSNSLQKRLIDGRYTAVVWGNLSDSDFYLTQGNGLDGGDVELLSPNDTIFKSELSLFHAKTEFVVGPQYSTDIVMSMVKNTNNVRIVFSGLDIGTITDDPADDIKVFIEGKNAVYDFHNNTIARKELVYYPDYNRVDADTMHAEMVTMGIHTHGEPRITIIDEGNPDNPYLYYGPLADLIISVYDDINNDSDLLKYDNYSVEFGLKRSEGTWVVGEIKGDSWKGIDNPGGGI